MFITSSANEEEGSPLHRPYVNVAKYTPYNFQNYNQYTAYAIGALNNNVHYQQLKSLSVYCSKKLTYTTGSNNPLDIERLAFIRDVV